jgi:heme oxygenase
MSSAATRSLALQSGSSCRAPGLRAGLRVATADAHARLDALLSDLDLRERAAYRIFLEASAAALLPLEDALAAAGVARLFPDWNERRRGSALRDDLARVGGEARPLALAATLDRDAVLGAMYVLEGSRLGGQILLRQAAASPDPVVAGATAYLRHGAGRHLWPSFLAALERHGEGLADSAGAVAGARLAFAHFTQGVLAARSARAVRP